ncbi:MAG: hypothetical protein NDI90_03065 [Nitrospira sp. BO4]|nr:hypothetical protein [Nitrospira sp. BO4]
MTRPLSDALVDLDDNFIFRAMEQHRHTILHVVQRFRSLDPMQDQEDLWQESWFGARNAFHSWDEARAINMQFKNYLTWHISRHLQGIFLGYDKVVDLIDQDKNLVVTIPYGRYRKQGRRIAKEKRYATRIRSLLVCYDDRQEERPDDQVLPAPLTDVVHLGEDQVVDVYNQRAELIVTIPLRTYHKKRNLIREQGLITQPWCIYDPRPSFPGLSRTPESHLSTPEAPAAAPRIIRRRDLISPTTATPLVADIYTRRTDILMRISTEAYRTHRVHLEGQGCIVRFHDPLLHPEQPAYADIEDEAKVIKSIRQIEHVA